MLTVTGTIAAEFLGPVYCHPLRLEISIISPAYSRRSFTKSPDPSGAFTHPPRPRRASTIRDTLTSCSSCPITWTKKTATSYWTITTEKDFVCHSHRPGSKTSGDSSTTFILKHHSFRLRRGERPTLSFEMSTTTRKNCQSTESSWSTRSSCHSSKKCSLTTRMTTLSGTRLIFWYELPWPTHRSETQMSSIGSPLLIPRYRSTRIACSRLCAYSSSSWRIRRLVRRRQSRQRYPNQLVRCLRLRQAKAPIYADSPLAELRHPLYVV